MKNDPKRLALAAVFCLTICAGLAFALNQFAS